MRAALTAPLAAALDAGATVVTPNNRLARRLVAMHDDAKRAAGARAWEAPTVLPWHAWLAAIATQRLERPDGGPVRVLSPAQAAHLWRRIVAEHASDAAPLLDVRGAAALAQQAWTIVHAYGAGGESWRGFSAHGDDEASFVRWADRYASSLQRLHADDAARLPDALARAGSAPELDRPVVLAGFLELDPQQQRLVAAFEAAGARTTHSDTLPAQPARRIRVEAGSPRDELALALRWARERAAHDPDATIGIAIDDLAQRRDEVAALAEDVLCAPLQWPGHESAARPYNVSVGLSLDETPLAATALDLIVLAHRALPVDRASALVRSPHIAGATLHWARRAAIERRWREQGRHAVDWPSCVSAMARDAVVGARWQAMRRDALPSRRASARAFADAWRAWLDAAGWPGDRALSSAEFQARGAFDGLLATFVSLGAVGGELTAQQALDALRALAADTLFQPESPRAPIQIVGWLEAAGMPLDALWIAGMSAHRWPAPPRPHPLLPVAWQRERGVPHASAQRELAFARALTDQLSRGAPEVVASHARTVDDHACVPSALTADWPLADVAAPPASVALAAFAARPTLEHVGDDRAPPIRADAPVRGGANVVESQSECPFRAFARHRLRVDTWPHPPTGLDPRERGQLLHAALAAFWREMRSHAALVALAPEELDARIDAAVGEAMRKLDPLRARELPPLVLATEPTRLCELIRQWIDAWDRPRPPFTVHAVEREASLALGGVVLSTRLDRVDALEGGGAAIIDYKGGEFPPLARWFDRRPSGTQLGVYALAWRAAERETPLRAVAFAGIAPGAEPPAGIAADERAWPGLALPRELPPHAPHDWASLAAWWHDAMSALARDFAAGEAAVDPREPDVCKRCGLHALCRIDAMLPEANADG